MAIDFRKKYHVSFLSLVKEQVFLMLTEADLLLYRCSIESVLICLFGNLNVLKRNQLGISA